jgi:hypothetical protein
MSPAISLIDDATPPCPRLILPPTPPPPTQVPDGAEDSLDALQHAGERLEADAAALRRGILLAAQRALASNREHRRDPSHAEEAKTVAALADLAPPSTERIDADDEDDHMGFGRTAFPGRETRRVDADIARRAATLEEQSNRFRSLASAATVAEAFARAETSMREGEAALARGEHERASTALGDVRAALTDGSLDAPSDASSIMKPISESSFAKSSTALGDLRAKGPRAIAHVRRRFTPRRHPNGPHRATTNSRLPWTKIQGVSVRIQQRSRPRGYIYQMY